MEKLNLRMMNKEQTPIDIKQLMFENSNLPKATEKGYFFMANQVEWLMEQYAQAKVLEALEREKDLKTMLFRAYCKPFVDDENKIEQDMLIVLLARFEKYYETEVKPKYKH
jgi:hypothetical protein